MNLKIVVIEETTEDKIKMTTNTDLMTLIKEMKAEVVKGNEELRRAIKEDNTNMKKEVKEDIAAIADKVERMKIINEKRNKEYRARSDRLEKRMENIETEMKKSKDQTIFREELRKKQEERVENFMNEVGMKNIASKEHNKDNTKDSTAVSEHNTAKVPETPDNELDDRTDQSRPMYKSDWAKSMDKLLYKHATKEVNVTQKDTEKVEKVETTVSKKDIKLGNSLDAGELHSETEWGWEEMNDEWEGTIGREQENRRKKLLRREKMKKIQMETAHKASHIIGVHPVTQDSLNNFYEQSKDYNKAKIEAAKEYLEEYLDFDEEDFKYCNITDTQMSGKRDDVMYIALDDVDIIKTIQKHVAERQNPEIYLRNFIPPKFFDRYCAINNLSRDLRDKYPDLKTLMRFNNTDIELLTKIRGSMEPYKVRELSQEEKNRLPLFDHTKVWKKKVDRPPRRSLSPTTGRIQLPSMRKETHGRPPPRQRSTSSQDLIKNKRQKRDITKEPSTDKNQDLESSKEKNHDQDMSLSSQGLDKTQ